MHKAEKLKAKLLARQGYHNGDQGPFTQGADVGVTTGGPEQQAGHGPVDEGGEEQDGDQESSHQRHSLSSASR